MPNYTLNMAACIQHLRSHAYAKSHHQCAAFVKSAMSAGGLPYFPANGGDNWRVCQKLGYIRYQPVGVNTNQYTPTTENRSPRNAVVGDICCVYSSGTVGHMCMFDGYQWISDFKQNTCIPYRTWWGATFWRWKDAPAGDFSVMSSDPGGGGGMYGQMSSQEALSNAYPVHNEYTTLTGSGGNIFESASYNSITAASMSTDASWFSPNSSVNGNQHVRIYSTNDSTIVLDELSLPIYHQDDNWANKYATVEQENEIINKNKELNKPKTETTDSSIA